MKLADWLKAIIAKQKKTDQPLQQLISFENNGAKLDVTKLIDVNGSKRISKTAIDKFMAEHQSSTKD